MRRRARVEGRGIGPWSTRAAALFACLLPAACHSTLVPVEFAPDQEVCAHCRMAVSQRELAAEAVRSGGVDFFDDIGCLAGWIKEGHATEGMAFFVVDFDTADWLHAESAHYLQSDQLPTPMKSGLSAYGDPSRARSAAARLEGRVLSWEEVLQEASP